MRQYSKARARRRRATEVSVCCNSLFFSRLSTCAVSRHPSAHLLALVRSSYFAAILDQLYPNREDHST
jgi:hypothetical protein